MDHNLKHVVIFGGTGFIGSFFANFLSKTNFYDQIYLLDIEEPDFKKSAFRRSFIAQNKNIIYTMCDVRKPIIHSFSYGSIGLVANFAAIHREPGHSDYEYFETNLLGAQNICEFSEEVGCNSIIFTSSISPYGVSESTKNENALPVPSTAYGSSKLVAEKMHQIWQAKDQKNRRLVIVRPGVVFGPGEGGNVSRLINAVTHQYFFYTGNRDTRKAGVYVKELCNAMWWVFTSQNRNNENISLFNMTMNPGPSIKEYIDAVCKVAGIKRYIPNLPYKLLLIFAYSIDFFTKPFGVKHPFSPVRIRKLVRSNNIIPTYLIDHEYQYQYTLESAFDDWKKSAPDEWR